MRLQNYFKHDDNLSVNCYNIAKRWTSESSCRTRRTS